VGGKAVTDLRRLHLRPDRPNKSREFAGECRHDRNANSLYYVPPNMHVLYHFIKDMPVRASASRSLGGHLNVFSIESMFSLAGHHAALNSVGNRRGK
jgi:hypothetical protein